MEGDLSSFVERTRSLLSESSEMAPRTMDLRITLPFLEALGWDVHGADVAADYTVETGEEGEFGEVTVDYALSLSDRPAVFVLTAGLEEPIEAAAGRRLEAAMAADGVEWGVITNGRAYVFVADGEDGPSHARCSLGDLPDRQSLLANYTRPAARRRQERRRRDHRELVAGDLRTRRDDLRTAVEGALTGDLEGPAAGELAAAGEAFVDAAVAAMADGEHPLTAVRSDPVEDGTGSSTPSDRSDDGTERPEQDAADDGTERPEQDAADDGTERPEQDAADDGTTATRTNGHDSRAAGESTDEDTGGSAGTGRSSPTDRADDDRHREHTGGSDSEESASAEGAAEDGDHVNRRGAASTAAGTSDEQYIVRFFSGRNSVGAIGHGTPGGALAQAVEYLVEQHALDGGITLPWGPTDDRAVINHDPVHPDGTEMVEADRISNGYFVCTTIGGEAIQAAVEELADTANLRVMFQGDW